MQGFGQQKYQTKPETRVDKLVTGAEYQRNVTCYTSLFTCACAWACVCMYVCALDITNYVRMMMPIFKLTLLQTCLFHNIIITFN